MASEASLKAGSPLKTDRLIAFSQNEVVNKLLAKVKSVGEDV